MTPLATLFTVVVALYLLECIVVVPDDALVLAQTRRGRWRPARTSFSLGGMRRRLVVVSPLRPYAGVLVLPAWQAALSPDGWAPRTPAGTSALPYESLDGLASAGTRVRWTSGALDVHSESRARWLTKTLAKLRDSSPKARERLIDRALADVTNGDEIRRRVNAYVDNTRWLRSSGTVLALHLLLIWPLAITLLGLAAIWPAVLIELVLLVTLVVWLEGRARRALDPRQPRDVARTVTLALSPPAASRAATQVARDLLGDLHPIAVALHLTTPTDALPLAARAWRDARFAPAANTMEEWFAVRWARELERVVERTVGLEALPTAPERDGASGSYCPRCWTQFAPSSGTCDDCGGVRLSTFTVVSS